MPQAIVIILVALGTRTYWLLTQSHEKHLYNNPQIINWKFNKMQKMQVNIHTRAQECNKNVLCSSYT